MDLNDVLNSQEFILAEGAVLERVFREYQLEMPEHILHAGLIYNEAGRNALRTIYKEYMDIGNKYNFPLINFTPTWRANEQRVNIQGLSKNVNADCVSFLSEIRAEYGDYAKNIFIGGLIGCKGDAYKPQEALSAKEAYEFHKYQVSQLSQGGADFLIAETLPAITEAIGIANLMAETGKNYIMSFVIRPDGILLDGTSLHEAIQIIDFSISPKPLCYMVNCVHPTILERALIKHNGSTLVKERLLGIQANTSSKSPEELDGIIELQAEDINIFANSMVNLYELFGIKILGGCCGTNTTHIQILADKIALSLKEKG